MFGAVKTLIHTTTILIHFSIFGFDSLNNQKPIPAELLSMEKNIFDLVNQHRNNLGLPALKKRELIDKVARKHSISMSNIVVPVGHNGFKGRAQFLSIFFNSGICSENVAFIFGDTDPGVLALQGWLKSTRHRQNVEGDNIFTGIGVAKGPGGGYYITQIFWKNY
ncbi:CAP domain-containing protein [Caldithrix abyssi]|nr:CAP domain-containing protein [Caldithrix abyssi]